MPETPDIILHHYPQSPVTEKVRVALGIKGLTWGSVIIPRLPPKPDLMALTGGYRLTPVMQVGADIYCDTQCILAALERQHPAPTLFPGGNRGLVRGMSRWTDGPFFKTVMALVFGDQGEALPADFARDRGTLYFGEACSIAALTEALPHTRAQVRAQFGWLEDQLADGRAFMEGDAPGLADVLGYYLVWFVRGRYSRGPDFLAPFAKLLAWEARVKAIGHGTPVEMSSVDAIGVAAAGEPAPAVAGDADDPQGLMPGQMVRVRPAAITGPCDTEGRVRSAAADEIVIERNDERAGRLAVHFPREGYHVTVL